jgi:DivIVA domain-containing protein
MIDPQSITDKKFRTTRVKEGYDQEEVDAFLDECADALRLALDGEQRWSNEAGLLRARNDELEARLSNSPTASLPIVVDNPSPSGSAAKLLEMAQRTADDLTAQASAQAAEIVEGARAQARTVVDEAERMAREVAFKATTEADAKRAKAEQELAEVEAKLAEITNKKNETRAFVEAQLSELRDKLA